MSSGTKTDPSAGRDTSMAMSSQVMDDVVKIGMSPRQRYLNRLWSYYQCRQYDTRKTAWDGGQHYDGIQHDAIATAAYLPPGFYDAGGAMLPLKFRRPTAPYHLVKVIVDRFTGLLFSRKRHPKVTIEGDPDTEDFVAAMVDEARLWATMIQARKIGGAQGSVAVGFQFIDGKPVAEVHDPRWTTPFFKDRSTLELNAIEKRYPYPVEVHDEEAGWVTVWMWYRRIIDDKRDILYKPVPVGDGEEPEWEVGTEVTHNFGFCPVQWIQNLPVGDDIDGEPDCQGIYDLTDSIDALSSQANRGTLANSDPTLVISSSAQMKDVSKGSDNAIKLPDGTAVYLELTGAGAKAALDLADKFRIWALEVAQCVLEHPDTAARTATEIERAYSSMLSKADDLREQYGECGVKPLIEKMVKAAKMMATPVVDSGKNRIVRRELVLPPKITAKPDGTVVRTKRVLGPGLHRITFQWPQWFDPSLVDIQAATTAAVTAKAGAIIDDEHAIKFVAEYFQVEDVGQLVQKMQDSAKAEQSQFEAMSMGEPALERRGAPNDEKPEKKRRKYPKGGSEEAGIIAFGTAPTGHEMDID